MTTRLLLVALVLATVLMPMGVPVALAEETAPYQIAVIDPLQLFSRDREIVGMRNTLIVGVSRSVYGLDLGTGMNVTQGDMVGIQIAPVNYSEGNTTGIRLGALNLTSGMMKGVDLGIINKADVKGIQIALLSNYNTNPKELAYANGIQIAAMNYVEGRCQGLQIGLINYCKSLLGAQIGIFNYVADNPIRLTTIVNVGFNVED